MASGGVLAAVAADVARVVEPQPSFADALGLPDTRKSVAVELRRAGRPPGAKNRRAEDVARFIVDEIGDPLLRLAMVAAMPTEELAARLGCTAAEALVEQRLAAIAVLPYVHQRKAISVDVTNRQVVSLTIGDLGVTLAETRSLDAVEVVANQELSEAADASV
jgi:hypothetical protein